MMLVACSGQWLSDTAGREQDVQQPRVPCSIMFAPIVMGGWWVNSDTTSKPIEAVGLGRPA